MKIIENEVTLKDQMKKFLIKGLYGFNTIILVGMGRRLGIFDYLFEKAQTIPDPGKISSITFIPDELSENLNLDSKWLDGYIHLALECGLFEIENPREKQIKTAPHVFDLLINRNHMFYIGDTIGGFYYIAPDQEELLDAFKKQGSFNYFDWMMEAPEEVLKDTHRMGSRFGTLIERLFSKRFKEFSRSLRKEGSILDVGCGCGYTLEVWAKKYKKTKFVGIDIHPRVIKIAKELVSQNKWDDRIDVLETSVKDYAKDHKSKFDLILMNQVLHEMDPDENYRREIFMDLHPLLKDDGLLLVGESMIPDTFDPKKEFLLFDITHKFFEAGIAQFYNEKTFKKFIDSTPFKNVEFIKEGGEYFWAVRK